MKHRNRWNKEYDENGVITKTGMKASRREIAFNNLLRNTKKLTADEMEAQIREMEKAAKADKKNKKNKKNEENK